MNTKGTSFYIQNTELQTTKTIDSRTQQKTLTNNKTHQFQIYNNRNPESILQETRRKTRPFWVYNNQKKLTKHSSRSNPTVIEEGKIKGE